VRGVGERGVVSQATTIHGRSSAAASYGGSAKVPQQSERPLFGQNFGAALKKGAPRVRSFVLRAAVGPTP
jgi:hypothetical protein